LNKQKKRTLLDKLIKDKWFSDEKEALPWLLQRSILIDNQPAHSLKQAISTDAAIIIKKYYKNKYVNKGGLKLEKALTDFKIDVNGKIILDCGASTGGFTDCLLQNGAKMIYAVDRGYGRLSSKLINNPKVTNIEKTVLSAEKLTRLEPKPDIITLDINDVSLRQAALSCRDILKDSGSIIALIKPIYEDESREINRHSFVDDKQKIKDILFDLCEYFLKNSFDILGLTYSPVRGNNGTLEYFIHLGLNTKNGIFINDEYDIYIDNIIDKSFLIEKFNESNKNSYIPEI